MTGTLSVVATPIGNLEDITLRALRVLREVDLIAAEDTRRTLKLLNHYEISKPLVSLREHNEARQGARLIDQMQRGAHIALVSDAGTPGIADPGARLVRAGRQAGVRVTPIPGASAVTAAISVAGLETTEFVFLGFPPPSRAQRHTWLERLKYVPWALVMFEAPHRAIETLADIAEILAERHIDVMREISKINEICVEYSTNNAEFGSALGEFVLVVGPPPVPEEAWVHSRTSYLVSIYDLLTKSGADSELDHAELLAGCSGLPQSTVAKLIKKHKIMVKQQNKTSPT